MNENIWRSRWSRDQIKSLLVEQSRSFWQRDTGIQRDQLARLQEAASLPHAVVISGLRRVGKSTLMAQVAHWLGEERFYYVNFEDDRFLGFAAEDADILYQILIEMFGERHVFVVDEVQNVPGWERFVRRFMDMGLKFYITGSNASLLSRELGSRLTGRYIPVDLFPFSFREFLRFRGYVTPDLARQTTADSSRMRGFLNEYLRLGGIPEPLKYPSLPLLRTLYDDVLYRDIASRYHIEEVSALKELAFYLISNPGTLVSYNKLKEHLRLGSVNTVKNYVEYMEDSWMLFTTSVYDFSVRRQQIAPKKVYTIDTGMATSVGFSFSPNTGRLLENAVFLALRRQTADIHYVATASKYEVDFYLPKTQTLIQVAQDMSQPETRAREIRALVDALRDLHLDRGLILTDANADDINQDGLSIQVRSLAEWLLAS